MAFHPEDPTTWPCFRPLIMAHDVARAGDRSTVVIGGLGPVRPPLTGVVMATSCHKAFTGMGWPTSWSRSIANSSATP